MNRITISGNITRDGELTFLPSTGTAKLSISIAVNDGYGDTQKTYFIPVAIWGNSAEKLADKLLKGTKVLVNGKLTITNYEDKQGNKRSFTEVVADKFNGIEFMGGKKVDDTRAGEMFNNGEYTSSAEGEDMPW